MIKTLNVLRRKGRAWKRSAEYPILLPHFSLDEQGLVGPLGEKYPLEPELREAVRLCDGTRPLADLEVGGKLMELYDEGKIVLWREPLKARGPEEQVDTIIVSPHPDDAALSVAHLLLASHGESVMVVDVFSQTAWWRLSDSDGDLDEIQRVRFAEEQLMARMASAKLRMLGLPEALLRGHALNNIFSSDPDQRDQDVRQKLNEAIKKIAAEHSHAHWYLPMTVGGHIDHRITKEAASCALKEAGVRSVCFYEELFYAAEAATPLTGGEQKPVDLKWKLELCRVYWSQFTAGRLKLLENYATRIGQRKPVERIWPTAPAGMTDGSSGASPG
ncbi:MAG TPA: PIG-L family deacetylase [Tepidisphaeraceae bacterium]|jgi:LmbE family N-acetylglucosaminyl deacetylase|nr:PIG-L family deacetylase [Tepidisphaeraceae bacterium]